MSDPNTETEVEEEVESTEIDESVAADIDAAWEQHDAEQEAPEEDDSNENEEPDSAGEAETDSALEPEPESQGAEEGEAEDAPEAQAKDIERPPAGLSAAAREAWKEADPALKTDIAKRERDYAVGLQKNAEQAKKATQMDQALSPFQPYLSANGGAQAVVDLLQVGTQLQLGTQQQKAAALAQVIKQFDVDINTLDNVLSGQMPQQQQQQPQMSENEQWLQQFRQQQEQQQYYQEQQQQQEVGQSVEQFMSDPKNEFSDLVREDMAVLLKSAAEMGKPMSMDEAYQAACMSRRDIAPIMMARQSSGTMQKKRRAGSSISGAPGGAAKMKEPSTITDALEDAWDNYNQV